MLIIKKNQLLLANKVAIKHSINIDPHRFLDWVSKHCLRKKSVSFFWVLCFKSTDYIVGS